MIQFVKREKHVALCVSQTEWTARRVKEEFLFMSSKFIRLWSEEVAMKHEFLNVKSCEQIAQEEGILRKFFSPFFKSVQRTHKSDPKTHTQKDKDTQHIHTYKWRKNHQKEVLIKSASKRPAL